MDELKQGVIEQSYALTKKYQMEKGNCAQCTLIGIMEALDVENDDVFRAATGFAAGVGFTGEGHCGALTGGVMAISYIFGRKQKDFSRRGKMLKSMFLANEFVQNFKEKYGVYRCCDLQTKLAGRFFNLTNETDAIAAARAGLPEKCSTLAAEVARMATNLILEQQDRDAKK